MPLWISLLLKVEEEKIFSAKEMVSSIFMSSSSIPKETHEFECVMGYCIKGYTHFLASLVHVKKIMLNDQEFIYMGLR